MVVRCAGLGYSVAVSVLSEIEHSYSPQEERPLRGYVAVMATYASAVTGIALILRGRSLPERLGVQDIGQVALATHKLSRLVTKDPVTSPLRAPFTRYEGVGGPSELNETVRGHGTRHAVGELLTCPFCVSQWIATALVFGLVVAPRPTRLVTALYSALALADLLQFARARAARAIA
jgi:hypothetical protein